MDEKKEDKDVQNFVSELAENQVTLDKIKKWIETKDDAKQWFESERDRHFSQGLETRKKKHLDKIKREYFEEEYSKKHPPETEEQKRIRELLEWKQKQEAEAEKIKLQNAALRLAKDEAIANLIVGGSEDEIKERYETLQKIISSAKEETKNEFVKQGFTMPPANDEKNRDVEADVFEKLWE